MKNIFKYVGGALMLGVCVASCQKMERPALAEYPSDNPVTPTTALRFYVPFDSANVDANQINIRFADSVSSYPSFFPDKSITYVEGIRGTAFKSVKGANLNYISSNDFTKSTSLTVAFWTKHDGVPVGEAEFAFSVPSTIGHWSNATMFLIFDHTGAGSTIDSAVIKFFILDSKGEKWFELVNNDRMPDIYDNEWHHLAFAYDETSSKMSIYRDGVLYKEIEWEDHGALTIDATKVSSFKLGGKTTDWGNTYIGTLDQFRLYNKALSAGEINALFTNKE